MRTISEQKLKDILDNHGKWLRNEEGGEVANLSYSDLSYSDLSNADLSNANLSYANLSNANLRSANLSNANLSSANLSNAYLSYANLSNAYLSNAYLSNAYGFKFKPIQIVNTKYFITIFDDHVLWGCKKMTFDEVKKFDLKDCLSDWEDSEFKLNKVIITELIRYYR